MILGGLTEDRSLILLDLRRTGDTAPAEDSTTYRCDHLVDDIEALRRHLNLTRSTSSRTPRERRSVSRTPPSIRSTSPAGAGNPSYQRRVRCPDAGVRTSLPVRNPYSSDTGEHTKTTMDGGRNGGQTIA
jgi:hypothetical protein